MSKIQVDFKFILRNKIYQIHSNSRFLNDINPCIYQKLTVNLQYEIQSHVRNEIFKYFIKYLVNREIPDINAENIYEFEALSDEFDVMKNLIQLFKKNISKNGYSTLLNNNKKLREKIQEKKDQLNQHSSKFKQIIHLLINNNGFDTYTSFYKIKEQLIDECQKEYVDSVDLLTRKKVEINGFIYNINEKEKTADLYRKTSIEKDIFIPRSIYYQSKEYLIVEICNDAFKYNNFIESITFEKNSELRIIGKESFESCMKLKSVTIPSTVTHINAYAFNNCYNLQYLNIPENSELIFIGNHSFSNTSIESLLIPSKATELQKCFCCSMQKLKDIKIMKENKNFIYYENKFLLGKSSQLNDFYDILLFARCDLEIVNIPSFIKIIGAHAFESNKTIKKVIFPENSELVSIKKLAFFFSSIESIKIPSNVKKISENSFSNCSNLKKVEIANNSELKVIKNSAFYSSSLEYVLVPKSVTILDNYSFSFCQNIKAIDFEENSELKIIKSNLLYISAIESFTIPSNVVEIEDGWCSYTPELKRINIMKGNKNFIYFENNFLLGKSSLMNDVYDILLFARRDIEIANIPPNIKIISPYAFEFCKKNLKK